MQKSYNPPFSYASFKRALQPSNDPIRIEDFETKTPTPRGFKKCRHEFEHFDNEPRVSRSLKCPQFLSKNHKNTPQPEETSTPHTFHRSNRTVERLNNSKDKKSTQFSSRQTFNKMSQYVQKQMFFTKDWPNEIKSATFNNFLQIPKVENPNQRSRFSFYQNSKLQKCKAQTYQHNFESLRETEDTIAEKILLQNKNVFQVQDFDLIKLLGKGKNGQVYLAIHKQTGFGCGLKIIKKRTLQKGTIEERKKVQDQLLNEIKIQMYLRHSNLIELYGVFDDTQNIYLIQELGVNGQLYELMKKRSKFSQQTTALMANDIISGIEYMHRQKVIHRDLKPQNMVLIYGVCKICDFGWSIYNQENQVRSTLCGTLLYISPQMLTGCDYNEKIDIWAYGILIYELFMGQNPFKIREKSDLNKVVTDQIIIGDNTPQKLKEFLLSVLQKQIQLRPVASQVKSHKWLQKYQDLETSEELAKM